MIESSRRCVCQDAVIGRLPKDEAEEEEHSNGTQAHSIGRFQSSSFSIFGEVCAERMPRNDWNVSRNQCNGIRPNANP